MGTASAGRTWLVVAAEEREFEGILKRLGKTSGLSTVPAQFARQADWRGDRWLLVANGPGPRSVNQALERKMDVTAMISTGFCGALDPSLRIAEIVVSRWALPSDCPHFTPGEIHSADRVAVTVKEKQALYAKTGAIAVEMEAATVESKAKEWSVPFYCFRAVSDTATEDMPLDFNLYRDASGRFSRARIALAAMGRPFTTIPALLRLDRNCRLAAEALGAFFADCRF